SYREEQRRFSAPSNPPPKASRSGCKAALTIGLPQTCRTRSPVSPTLSCTEEGCRARPSRTMFSGPATAERAAQTEQGLIISTRRCALHCKQDEPSYEQRS